MEGGSGGRGGEGRAVVGTVVIRLYEGVCWGGPAGIEETTVACGEMMAFPPLPLPLPPSPLPLPSISLAPPSPLSPALPPLSTLSPPSPSSPSVPTEQLARDHKQELCPV